MAGFPEAAQPGERVTGRRWTRDRRSALELPTWRGAAHDRKWWCRFHPL